MSTNEPEQHEIVIVRRRSNDDHDEHHGGVWKVAFADFMTAMMAFFLVLWIVNSTTKQTRSSLARYFNPIRLSDTTPARKGLNDPREVDFDASAKSEQIMDRETKESVSAADGSLTTAEKIVGQPASESVNGQRKARGDRAGRQSSEPFPGMSTSRRPQPQDATRGDRGQQTPVAQAEALRATIRSLAGIEDLEDLNKALSVVEIREGVLIRLTDQSDAGGFAVGSSDPEQRLKRLLSAIAQAVKGRTERVIIRGHTDSRQYKGRGYDNWRLSFARAQMALAGLLSGGLDERRVDSVEGHADRDPRNRTSPDAPENRRIEILLKQETGRR